MAQRDGVTERRSWGLNKKVLVGGHDSASSDNLKQKSQKILKIYACGYGRNQI